MIVTNVIDCDKYTRIDAKDGGAYILLEPVKVMYIANQDLTPIEDDTVKGYIDCDNDVWAEIGPNEYVCTSNLQYLNDKGYIDHGFEYMKEFYAGGGETFDCITEAYSPLREVRLNKTTLEVVNDVD